MRALVIEDDADMLFLIRSLLEHEGFSVDSADNGEEGATLAFVNDPDLIVLDLGLPDRHGLTVVQSLRREGRTTPILVLTGDQNAQMTVRALDSGADDYMKKPIAPDEFCSRVRALVRRGGASRTETLVCGNVVLNRLARDVRVDGEALELTAREFAVLEHFLLHENHVITRTTLLEKVWDMNFDPKSNVVDVVVARLRKKLDGSKASVRIVAKRGIGFVFTGAHAA